MRPGQQNKRGRGRNNGSRKSSNPLSRSYDSAGPDVKVRGNAQTVAEKYLALARDAQSSGDSIMAENYLQHAEHYNRIVALGQSQMQERQQRDEAIREQQEKIAETAAEATENVSEEDIEMIDDDAKTMHPDPSTDETLQKEARRTSQNRRRPGYRQRRPRANETDANPTTLKSDTISDIIVEKPVELSEPAEAVIPIE